MSFSFKETRGVVPVSGKWLFQLGDEVVEDYDYDLAVKHVSELLRRHGIQGSASQALADFMCPRLPHYVCNGWTPSALAKLNEAISPREAKDNARPYVDRQLATIDLIRKRMAVCEECPRHRRDFCLHCIGADSWIYQELGYRRSVLPEDHASGCCSASKTFEALICSVLYPKGEAVWKNAPSGCWRNIEK